MLYCRIAQEVKTIVNTIEADVTSCSATMGLNSVQGDWGYGLMVAWTTIAGSVFYAQLESTANVWGDGLAVTAAPVGAVEVVVSRVSDTRMIFLVKNSAGTVTEMLFRSIAISLSNVEQVQLFPSKIGAQITPLTYQHNDITAERVEPKISVL